MGIRRAAHLSPTGDASHEPSRDQGRKQIFATLQARPPVQAAFERPCAELPCATNIPHPACLRLFDRARAANRAACTRTTLAHQLFSISKCSREAVQNTALHHRILFLHSISFPDFQKCTKISGPGWFIPLQANKYRLLTKLSSPLPTRPAQHKIVLPSALSDE